MPKGSTHFVEEIHQPSQLRSPKARQVAFLFVALDQAIEEPRDLRRRTIKRVEVL